jgi:transposase
MSNGISGISIEDTQRLLEQLQRFHETIGGDWKSVMSQWQNLQDCWRDRQYDRFEPYFEQLCQTYDLSERQCEEYIRFLEERIHRSEAAAAMINM